MQSRFENAISNIMVTAENLSAARGRIIDADFATETANLSRAQILQQAGTAMVAQANQLPQQVLQLLQQLTARRAARATAPSRTLKSAGASADSGMSGPRSRTSRFGVSRPARRRIDATRSQGPRMTTHRFGRNDHLHAASAAAWTSKASSPS